MLLLSAAGVQPALAQIGGFGGRGGMGRSGMERPSQPAAPKLPGPELEGPPDSATLSPVVNLTPDQAARYTAARDSFMMETRALRDSAHTVQDAMYQRLDGGDRAAALFYADRLERVGKELKQRQEGFESRLSRILSGDQVKAYKEWRKKQDQVAELKAQEEAVRWRALPFGTDRPAAEPKTFVDQPDLPRPDAGSQAVRVGRTIYVASQVALDPAGTIVGENDLARQAVQAFANLTRVLDAARALPSDVVRLTIYVVDYQPEDLPVIRQAGAAYFPVRDPPVVTVVGVQSLSRPGLLIAVEATAVEGGGFAPQRAGPPRR